MKVNELINKLQELVSKNEAVGEYDVVTQDVHTEQTEDIEEAKVELDDFTGDKVVCLSFKTF